MLPSLLRLLLLVALAYLGWRTLLWAKAQLDMRRAALRSGGPVRRRADGHAFDVIDGGEAEVADGPQVIPMRDDPYALLDVAPDASDDEVEAAYHRLLDQNSPERVAGMSDEIRATAARMTRRIEQAWKEVQRRRGR